jgi:PadR family transcriptional regulator, regulatory protein PadR
LRKTCGILVRSSKIRYKLKKAFDRPSACFRANFRIEHTSATVRTYVSVPYNGLTHMPPISPDHEWKKGSAELLVLSLLEARPRHGYDISKLIQLRSEGALRFHVTSLYPLLYRLEKRGWVEGRWVEKPDQRRRRYYTLTPEGRKVLRSQRKSWRNFVAAISRITGIEHA